MPLLDLGALAERLGPDLRRPDAQPLLLPGRRRCGAASRPRPWTSRRTRRIEDLCLASDVLVTDYSSLMFDYAVLDRPIVIHAPDWDDVPRRTRAPTST